MSASQVIASYESLATLTAQMREAAVQKDWDHLIAIEQQRSKLVETIKSLDAAATLDDNAQQRKVQLIQEVMADDDEIRTLVQAWMGELQLSIQSNLQEQRLQRTYGV